MMFLGELQAVGGAVRLERRLGHGAGDRHHHARRQNPSSRHAAIPRSTAITGLHMVTRAPGIE
jgi:hypothetical protein